MDDCEIEPDPLEELEKFMRGEESRYLEITSLYYEDLEFMFDFYWNKINPKDRERFLDIAVDVCQEWKGEGFYRVSFHHGNNGTAKEELYYFEGLMYFDCLEHAIEHIPLMLAIKMQGESFDCEFYIDKQWDLPEIPAGQESKWLFDRKNK